MRPRAEEVAAAARLHEEAVARVWLDGETDECGDGHPVPWRGLCPLGHRGAVAVRMALEPLTAATEVAA